MSDVKDFPIIFLFKNGAIIGLSNALPRTS